MMDATLETLFRLVQEGKPLEAALEELEARLGRPANDEEKRALRNAEMHAMCMGTTKPCPKSTGGGYVCIRRADHAGPCVAGKTLTPGAQADLERACDRPREKGAGGRWNLPIASVLLDTLQTLVSALPPNSRYALFVGDEGKVTGHEIYFSPDERDELIRFLKWGLVNMPRSDAAWSEAALDLQKKVSIAQKQCRREVDRIALGYGPHWCALVEGHEGPCQTWIELRRGSVPCPKTTTTVNEEGKREVFSCLLASGHDLSCEWPIEVLHRRTAQIAREESQESPPPIQERANPERRAEIMERNLFVVIRQRDEARAEVAKLEEQVLYLRECLMFYGNVANWGISLRMNLDPIDQDGGERARFLLSTEKGGRKP